MMRSPQMPPVFLLALAGLFALGCERSTDGLRPFPLSTDPVVFDDDFGAYVDFQAFLGSKYDAVSIDPVQRHAGTTSLKVTVPAPGDPSGGYAGGAFVAAIPRDLSGYDALTFWAKASKPVTLDVAGLGNDNTGTSLYEARRNAIPVDTVWTRFVVPVPLPERISAERGLFFMAEGPEGGTGFDLWFDEVRFENTGVVSNPRPSMTGRTVNTFVGATIEASGTQTIFNVSGVDVTVGHAPSYFDYESSNTTVASAAGGLVRIIGPGTTTVTARLGGVVATGALTINAIALPPTPAPTPSVPAADVISLFSGAYVNVPVDTWSAQWDQAEVTDVLIAGDHAKGYTNLVFAGIEFVSQTIDATAMTHFHLDVFVPSGTIFRVKLVDFGANGVYGGGDDREQELTFNSGTTPAMIPGTWSSLEIPLADFTNLTTRAHLAQLILSGASTAFVDNVYLHR